MSETLSHIYLYIVDNNYFRSTSLKKIFEELEIPNDVIILLHPNQMEKLISNYQTDINDIFLFSTDLDGNQCFLLAKRLRKQCKKCQIALYGSDVSSLMAKKLNYISAIGVIDLGATDVYGQIKKLLNEAIFIKKERLHEKKLIPINNRKELYFFDSDCVNYITTIKGERNRIEIHQSRSIDYVCTAIKNVKKLELPDYFLVFKFYIINVRQIKKLNRNSNVIIFFNGEKLEVGNRIQKAIFENLIN